MKNQKRTFYNRLNRSGVAQGMIWGGIDTLSCFGPVNIWLVYYAIYKGIKKFRRK